MTPKIFLVCFYTQGQPCDNGKDLASLAKNIKSRFKCSWEHIIMLAPSLLSQQDPRWIKVFNTTNFVELHGGIDQRPSSLNASWIALNSMLWKPMIISSLLSEQNDIPEGSVIVYHDINASEYPEYYNNLSAVGRYAIGRLRHRSILLIADCLFPLCWDCKQELLRKYLHSEGRSLCHRWAGCLAFKKNEFSRAFCHEWLSISCIEENRSQITKYADYPGFRWHSPEQSTLSVVYYYWRYRLLKGRHIKRVFTPVARKLVHRWRLIDCVKFFASSVKFHSRTLFFGSFLERMAIIRAPKFMLSDQCGFRVELPPIDVGVLLDSDM